LSPKAAARIAREAATQSFDNAARALNIDWGMQWDGKQIQRWAEALGQTLVNIRQHELKAFKKGVLPASKANDHQLPQRGRGYEAGEETADNLRGDNGRRTGVCSIGANGGRTTRHPQRRGGDWNS
jgi:hypothetical protein